VAKTSGAYAGPENRKSVVIERTSPPLHSDLLVTKPVMLAPALQRRQPEDHAPSKRLSKLNSVLTILEVLKEPTFPPPPVSLAFFTRRSKLDLARLDQQGVIFRPPAMSGLRLRARAAPYSR